ncbi:type-2 ice-structuring protein-like isoform X2 [Trachinotus anak]|uniref:type-2 ice-structuring protein-like isoform X2 n=1 Tax=Trachinotus anak TaxID=443729 RepID=UPI0039F25962
MKMLTFSLFMCAMMALTRAAALPQDPAEHESMVTIPPKDHNYYGGWAPFSCPDGWTMYSTRCLLFISSHMTWDEAETNCRALQGNLASVYNAEHAREIHEVMQRAGHEHEQVWVGGHNTAENPSWSWSDYLSVNLFHHWCRQEPAKHEHHCLQATFEENMSGCLDDKQCDAQLPSVCSIILM